MIEFVKEILKRIQIKIAFIISMITDNNHDYKNRRKDKG